MTQVESAESSQSKPPAPGAASENLSAALVQAFPPLDAPAFPVQEEASPVDGDIRAVVPPPVLVSADELADELRGQRILFKRGPASVPIEVLLAIGFSLGFHAVLMGVFWLSLFFAVRAAGKGPAGWAAEADSGGSGGYMIMGTGPQGEATLAGDVRDMLAKVGGAASPVPDLPVLEKRDPLQAMLKAELSSPEMSMIGVPRGSGDLGTIKVHAPPAPVAAVIANNFAAPAPLAVAAKSPDRDPTAVASAAGKTGAHAASPTEGPGLGGGDDDTPVIDIMKPGAGGTGSGQGKHAGDGIDRGASGANNESPQVLDAPPLDVPIALRLKRPKHKAEFEVTVLADGRPGEIKLTATCGQSEIDALCQATVAKYRFRPAYLAGRAIAKSMTVSFSFGEDQ